MAQVIATARHDRPRLAIRRGSRFAKSTGRCQNGNAIFVISQNVAKHFVRVLPQKRSSDGVNRRCQAQAEWRFDIRHESRNWMWNTAKPVTVACFGGFESLLDSAKIAGGNVGLSHFLHPTFQPVAHERLCDNCPQLLLVGRSLLSRREARVRDQVWPLEHFRNEATK